MGSSVKTGKFFPGVSQEPKTGTFLGPKVKNAVCVCACVCVCVCLCVCVHPYSGVPSTHPQPHPATHPSKSQKIKVLN